MVDAVAASDYGGAVASVCLLAVARKKAVYVRLSLIISAASLCIADARLINANEFHCYHNMQSCAASAPAASSSLCNGAAVATAAIASHFSFGQKLRLELNRRRHNANCVSQTRSSNRTQAVSVRPAVAFAHLSPDDFRHPLDKQNTALLKALPGLTEIGKMILGPIAEQVMLLENIGNSVHVTEKQLPDLHQIMVEASKILCIDAPDLYVRQNPVPNAYTLAIRGRKPFVVLHTSIIELLTLKELQAVIAHELGHLKCEHGIWLTFANILMLGTYSIPGIGAFVEEQLFRWLRATELTCDRAALLVVQDPKVIVSVLMKLAGGCRSFADQLNVDEFLDQARSYDAASSSPFGWYLRNAQTQQLSHPLPVLRAREIDEWSRSPQYKALLARESGLRAQQK